MAAIVAFHFVLALVMSHRHGAILALQGLAAGAAQHHGRISAAIEEDHDLLFFLQALTNFFRQLARNDLLFACFLKLLAHIDDLDFGQRTLLDAVGQLNQRIFIFLGVVIRL